MGGLGPAPLPRLPARRVLSVLRRGSSAPVVVETDAGRFVVKLRGAAQGLPPLVAEVVVAELAGALGLAVPERAVVVLDPQVPREDHDSRPPGLESLTDEIADLLDASPGENLGVRLLPGAKDVTAERLAELDRDWALRVAWLDGLVMNRDRTRANPNILLWHGAPWLIDHGAALTFHHDWRSLTEQSPRETGPPFEEHALFLAGSSLASVDEEAARALPREVLHQAADRIPETFFPAGEDAARTRAAYVAFLWKRLAPPRPFVR